MSSKRCYTSSVAHRICQNFDCKPGDIVCNKDFSNKQVVGLLIHVPNKGYIPFLSSKDFRYLYVAIGRTFFLSSLAVKFHDGTIRGKTDPPKTREEIEKQYLKMFWEKENALGNWRSNRPFWLTNLERKIFLALCRKQHICDEKGILLPEYEGIDTGY